MTLTNAVYLFSTDLCVIFHLKIIHQIQRLLLSIYIAPVFISSNIFFQPLLIPSVYTLKHKCFYFHKLEMNIIKNPNFLPPVLFWGYYPD